MFFMHDDEKCREKGKAEFKKVGVTPLINFIAYEQFMIFILS